MTNVLGEFVQQQLDVRGWRQIDLVRASGSRPDGDYRLTKQVVSWLLKTGELHRMIEPTTVAGLAHGLGVDESVILALSAEAAGIPVSPAVADRDSLLDAALLDRLEALLTQILASRHRTPSDPGLAPNLADADKGGGVVGSGNTSTLGEVRDPRRLSHGGDSDPFPEHQLASLL